MWPVILVSKLVATDLTNSARKEFVPRLLAVRRCETNLQPHSKSKAACGRLSCEWAVRPKQKLLKTKTRRFRNPSGCYGLIITTSPRPEARNCFSTTSRSPTITTTGSVPSACAATRVMFAGVIRRIAAPYVE